MQALTSTSTLHNSALTVLPDHGQMRLDKFMSLQFPDFSRTFLQHLVEQERVRINGAVAHKPSTVVRPGDCVEVEFPEKKQRSELIQPALDLGITVLFEHEHFFIMYKPAGVLMHPAQHESIEPTMVDWLLQTYPELATIGPSDRPAIVHRLDKETSGLLVVPRSNRAHVTFGAMFKQRSIHKTYLAIVQGHPAKEGVIDCPIGRSTSHRKKMAAFPGELQYIGSVSDLQKKRSHKVRHAVTHYRVLENFDEYSLVELKPITGRTHQIRVHMQSIKHPLLGDRLYGQTSKLIHRHALHAAQLDFEFDGQVYSFSAPIPDDFKQVLSVFRFEQ